MKEKERPAWGEGATSKDHTCASNLCRKPKRAVERVSGMYVFAKRLLALSDFRHFGESDQKHKENNACKFTPSPPLSLNLL